MHSTEKQILKDREPEREPKYWLSLFYCMAEYSVRKWKLWEGFKDMLVRVEWRVGLQKLCTYGAKLPGDKTV
jgi:hypothetical protein